MSLPWSCAVKFHSVGIDLRFFNRIQMEGKSIEVTVRIEEAKATTVDDIVTLATSTTFDRCHRSSLISFIDKTQFNPFVQKVDRKNRISISLFACRLSHVACRLCIWCIGCSFERAGCACVCARVGKWFNRPIIEWIFIHMAFFGFWFCVFLSFRSVCSKDSQTLFNFESCIHSTQSTLDWCWWRCRCCCFRSANIGLGSATEKSIGRKMKIERLVAIDRSRAESNGRTDQKYISRKEKNHRESES